MTDWEKLRKELFRDMISANAYVIKTLPDGTTYRIKPMSEEWYEAMKLTQDQNKPTDQTTKG